MPLVHQCAADGCETLTMGELCLEHEAGRPGDPVGKASARGRKLALAMLALTAAAVGAAIRSRLPA